MEWQTLNQGAKDVTKFRIQQQPTAEELLERFGNFVVCSECETTFSDEVMTESEMILSDQIRITHELDFAKRLLHYIEHPGEQKKDKDILRTLRVTLKALIDKAK